MPAAQGAVVPIWSRAGNELMFVANDGLWLSRSAHGAPVEIAGPLLAPKDWSPFYAQIDWTDQFAWSR